MRGRLLELTAILQLLYPTTPSFVGAGRSRELELDLSSHHSR